MAGNHRDRFSEKQGEGRRGKKLFAWGGSREDDSREARVASERPERRWYLWILLRMEGLPEGVWAHVASFLNTQLDGLAFAVTCKGFASIWSESQLARESKRKGRRASFARVLNADLDLLDQHQVTRSDLWFLWAHAVMLREREVGKATIIEVSRALDALANELAANGNTHVLLELHSRSERGVALSPDKILSAGAKVGRIEVMAMCVDELGAKPDVWTSAAAAGEGNLHALKWLRSLDPPCPWHVGTCWSAARGGHLDCLRFAREEGGCEWDEDTCAEAAGAGNLDILKWARTRVPPCPWDEWTPWRAAKAGHLGVLRWCQEHNCPVNRRACAREAGREGHAEIIEFFRLGY